MDKMTTRARLRNKLCNKKEAEYKKLIESEPKWDSETESESEDEYYSSEDEFDETEEKLVEKYGKPAVKKYRITKQYNVDSVTLAFLRAIDGMKEKHINLTEFGRTSGIVNDKEKNTVIGEVVDKIIIKERERRGHSTNLEDEKDIYTHICDMETMNKIYPCIYGINILRLVGCIDFLQALPWRRLPSDIEEKLRKYIDYNKEHLSGIVTDIDWLTPIETANDILSMSFGIKIKNSNGTPYLKSMWIYDDVHKRILPITTDGKDNRLLPIKQ